jgi:hypothetical protein
MANRRAITLAALVLAIVPVSALGAVRGSFQRTLQVNGPVDLQIYTHSGDITVRAGSPGSVTINAKIHVSDNFFGLFASSNDGAIHEVEQNPPIRQTANMIKIDYPQYSRISIDYDVTVPPDTTLRTNTGSGDQNIRGVRPLVSVHAGSGDITLAELAGGARVETGSGNIHGDSVNGAFDARAGSGDIRVSLGGSGDIRVHTGSGNIELHNVNGGMMVEAGSGDLTADGQQHADWNIRTGSGNVRLRLPRDASFDVDVSTSSGDVTVDHPVNTTVQGKVQEGSRRHIAGKVGNGGPLLKVHTGSGDVHID